MGRIAIVTGAASGIGKALAGALVARGDTVVAADVDKDGAERTAGEVSERGPGAGVVHGVHAAYPVMVEQRSGHIVNTASLAGLLPSPGATPYAMTKHGVVGLSLSLRAEAAEHGVRVTAVCPGVVETPILDKGGPDDLPKPATMGHAREFFRHVQPRFYASDRLAQDILRAIDRNTALVIAPASARIAWYLWRYAPLVVNRMTARQIAWARARFSAEPVSSRR